MIRNQLRTTSSAVIGVPSEKARPGRRWKTTVAPPSRKSHEAASAGRGWSGASIAVRPSNSWAETAALPMSPWAAGSRSPAAPIRIRTFVVGRADGGADGGTGDGPGDRRRQPR